MNTIVALATPPMKSTIHIIRLSGPETYNIINKICTNKIEKMVIQFKIIKSLIKIIIKLLMMFY